MVSALVQSQAGVKSLGVVAFPYASATSTLEIDYVRVVKPDGSVINTPDENILDMPADITRQAPFYSDLKEKQVAVKGLEVGDVVEYSYHVEVKKPVAPGQFWFNYNFARNAIVLDESLQVSVPGDRYVQIKSPDFKPQITEDQGRRVYTWAEKNLEVKSPSKKKPGKSPSEENNLAAVQITSFKSWDELGQWFRALAAPRAVPTPDVAAKAAELTKGATTPDQKIQILYNYVSTKYRYIGIGLGIGRYQPHSASEVLTNDYGDCKDKHTLLTALLASVGITAEPALVRVSGKIDPEVPSPAQFDHVVTVIPQGSSYLWLDATEEVGPEGYLIPALRDSEALLMPPDGPAKLVKTPAEPPFKSFLSFLASGELSDTGIYKGKVQMSMRGDFEYIMRSALFETPQPQWSDVMQRVSYSLSFAGTVSNLTASDPTKTDSPLQVSYDYTRENFGDWANRRIIPAVPPMGLPDIPEDASKDSPPISIDLPEDIDLRSSIKLPPGSQPGLPSSQDLVTNFAEYHSKYSFSSGTLDVERSFTRKVKEIPAADFDDYKKFKDAVGNEEENFISLNGQPFPTAASTATSGTPDAQALYAQGVEAMQRGDVNEGLSYFQSAVKKDPSFAQGWIALAMTHFARHEMDEGIAQLNQAISLNPTMVSAYQVLARAYQSSHRPDDAVQVWKRLEKADPKNADGPTNAANILLSEERYSDAIPELENVQKLNPADMYSQANLADAYLHTGQKEKGLALFKSIADSKPPRTVMNNIAYALADNGLNLDQALAYSQDSVSKIESDTDDVSLSDLKDEDLPLMGELSVNWDTLGWVYFKMKQYEKAEKYLDAAWHLTEDPTIADHLGQLYEAEGKKPAAVHTYAMSLATHHAPIETQSRLDALAGSKVKAEDAVNAAYQSLSEVRTVSLPRITQKASLAEFFVMFVPGSKVDESQFVSGSEELRDAGDVLEKAKFDVPFPDSGPVKIFRRGALDCEQQLSRCQFVMFQVQDVHSIN